jgi:two-component system phosphate regulon response regulator PhoB
VSNVLDTPVVPAPVIALVVDDEPDIRSVVVYVLEKAGFVVHQESEGEAGLATAKLLRPDVILVDWMMPNMSGLDLCRALRASAELGSAAVILLTAKAQASDVLLGFAAGAQDYIVKPFKPQELAARVQEVLDRVR